MHLRYLPLFLLPFFLPQTCIASDAWDRVQKTGLLRWGGDSAGGAPYVFPDRKDPSKLIGFEVEIMEAVGRQLKVKTKLVEVPWEELVPALLRDDYDTVVNGLEVTADRQAVIDFSIPYYYFSEQITARKGDKRFQTFEDLRGHKVGTLAASLAYTLLAKDPAIHTVPYPSPVEAYRDLEHGRVDAVLMDGPIAAWYADANSALRNTGNPVGESTYGAGVRKDSPELRRHLDEAFRALAASGELERIYRRWNMWNATQSKLNETATMDGGVAADRRGLWRYVPLLVKGAGMTVSLSILSMALAIFSGSLLCFGKLYGSSWLQRLCSGYIEVVRGTPLLIQLYLLYYGLPNIGIHLNAFTAAILGMGLNYGAYEAEIYRAGLLSIPKGQSDAAKSLGMTPNQTLRFILAPQALRTILPPSTNDFIALFKDTSLVSIITVTELTKVYTTASTVTYRFLELGLITAALYFAMSYPLSLWSRRLERKHNATLH